MIRAFVALNLEPAAHEHAARFAESLRTANAARVTWVAAANMHVTLKFLGMVGSDQVAALSQAVAAHAGKPAPPTRLARFDAFPSMKHARILIVALDDRDGALARLAADMDAVAEPLGIAREARAYSPHLTLARARTPFDARRAFASVPFAPLDTRVVEMALYQSDLGPRGPVYTPLARAAFA